MLPRIGRVFQGVRVPLRFARAVSGLLSVALGFALLGSGAYLAATSSAVPTVYAKGSSGAGSVTDISSTCFTDGLQGSISVKGPISDPGGTITLQAYADIPGDNFANPTGGIVVVTVDSVAGGATTSYPYSVVIPAQYFAAPYNSVRVQIDSTTIAGLNGTTTKGPSLTCGAWTPTPTPTPTSTPTPTPTSTPTPWPTPTPTSTPTPWPTPTPTDTPTPTPTPTPTDTPTPKPTPTPTGTPTPKPTPKPKCTPTPKPTPTPTGTPTPSPTPTPTGTPTPSPTPTPTDTPTPKPTPTPTDTPKPTPTSTPADTPTPTSTPASVTTPTDSPSPASGALAETGGFDYSLLLVGLVILGAGLILLGTLVLRPRRKP